MARVSARTQRLNGQALAALDAEAPLPVSTSALLVRAGLAESDRGDVLRLLNRMAASGDIEKITLDGMRCRYWRSWPDQRPHPAPEAG
jgi:hypothetical protein